MLLVGCLIGWLASQTLSLGSLNGASDIDATDTVARAPVSGAIVNRSVPNWCIDGNSDQAESCKPPVFKDVHEIIMVVEDLDASMKEQWELFGIGPWSVWTFDESTVANMMQHDELRPFSAKIGYAKIGNIYWELVQPLDQHSTYYETLRDHGEGVHNIVFYTDGFDDTVEYMSSLGIGVYNSGNWQGTEFLNFNTRPHLPVIAEIFKYPESGEFPPPEQIYPEP